MVYLRVRVVGGVVCLVSSATFGIFHALCSLPKGSQGVFFVTLAIAIIAIIAAKSFHFHFLCIPHEEPSLNQDVARR